MGIVVIGAVFVDIKGFPLEDYIPDGRNAGTVKYIHGGVCRNIVEDIANLELRPTFVSIVDESALGVDVIHKLNNHKVDTSYVRTIPNGMGTWLAVFDEKGDLAGSISQRPDLMPILDILEEQGDEIFANADSIIVEADTERAIVKKILQLGQKHGKKVYAAISNMNIGVERRDLLQQFNCLICNELEAGVFFADDYSDRTPEEMVDILADNIEKSHMEAMIVTMGSRGAVYAGQNGEKGFCPANRVNVKDTTGAGDAFCAGAVSALTYGKSLAEATKIGSRLAASVIISAENVCPRFQPEELGIDIQELG